MFLKRPSDGIPLCTLDIFWSPFQYPIRRLIVRSCEESKPREWQFEISHSCETLKWRPNKSDGISNHQPHDCLLNLLFGRWSKKTSKLRVTGLCEGNIQCCQCACRISEWSDYSKYKPHGFETSGDRTMRHLIVYWNEALVADPFLVTYYFYHYYNYNNYYFYYYYYYYYYSYYYYCCELKRLYKQKTD